jgi:hypothetical protein
MIMLSFYHDTISAEKSLSMVFATFYIAIIKLDIPTIAVAFFIVVTNPIT